MKGKLKLIGTAILVIILLVVFGILIDNSIKEITKQADEDEWVKQVTKFVLEIKDEVDEAIEEHESE